MTAPALTLATLAQRRPADPDSAAAALIILAVYAVMFAVLVVPTIAGMWKVFEKAGKPGWAALVPIYNQIVLFEVTDKPIWWIALYLIPCVNVIASLVCTILVSLELAKRFRRGDGFGIGLALLPFVFYPILGFGDDQYRGSKRRRPAYDDYEEYDEEPRPRRRQPADDYDE